MYTNSETIAAITRFLFIGQPENALTCYDLVIVLGNDDIDGTVAELKRLWINGHFAEEVKIILSGNVGALNQGKAPEAERLFQAAISAGMPAKHFLLEKEATNALENFQLSKIIIEHLGGFDTCAQMLCIGKAFMLRRAKMCAAACHYPLEKLTFYGTVDKAGRNIGPDSWWQTDTARKRVLEELGRISTYALRGDISID